MFASGYGRYGTAACVAADMGSGHVLRYRPGWRAYRACHRQRWKCVGDVSGGLSYGSFSSGNSLYLSGVRSSVSRNGDGIVTVRAIRVNAFSIRERIW